MGSAFRLVFAAASLAAGLWLGDGPAYAVDAADLYRARTIVTGQEEPTRSRGFAECLKLVLVKVSGDPRLADDPAVAAVAAHAANYVSEFRYHDRMSGIPVHDEQGTRERPHDLFVSFKPETIDATLKELGREPWTKRPRILMLVGVDNGAQAFVLAGDGQRGRGMREAIAAAADRFGMELALPATAVLKQAGLTQEGLPTADLEQLQALAQAEGSESALVGGINWNPEALGWSAEWTMESEGKTHRWSVNGVSFDARSAAPWEAPHRFFQATARRRDRTRPNRCLPHPRQLRTSFRRMERASRRP
jgi:hypothetical protein